MEIPGNEKLSQAHPQCKEYMKNCGEFYFELAIPDRSKTCTLMEENSTKLGNFANLDLVSNVHHLNEGNDHSLNLCHPGTKYDSQPPSLLPQEFAFPFASYAKKLSHTNISLSSSIHSNNSRSSESISLEGERPSEKDFLASSIGARVISSGSLKNPVSFSSLHSSSGEVRHIMSALPYRLSEDSLGNLGLNCKKKSKRGQNISSKYMLQRKPVKNPFTVYKEFLKLKGVKAEITPSLDIQNFFLQPSKKDMDAYDKESIAAIRAQDISLLRKMHKNGKSLQCCNTFGESLLHMACRRGFTEVVKFLIEEAGVSIRVRDDYGRTPLHDACWTSEPNFQLMDLLICEDPDLFLMSDKRGHTPFQYIRREHWEKWTIFLESRRKMLLPRHFPFT